METQYYQSLQHCMADQAAAKKTLQELIKHEDLNNKVCNDCSTPNPQWASLSFAVFLCLQCAGVHRGFGVHISFVRSVSMDTWQDEQIKRMQLGGNAPFRQFMRDYTPADLGGYKEGVNSYDTYHCWAATQYREKLDASLAGKPWFPSPPPANAATPGSNSGSPGRPSSAQGLRKSRTSSRTAMGSSLRSDSASPSSLNPSPRGTPDLSSDRKTGNESYFSSLGQLNASRPADLPPSQGGRYQGFGSTPSPAMDSRQPSFGLSSSAAPSISEFQENPMAALTKGWSLFSSAVAGASRAVTENIVQPGVEKMSDPALQASVKGYISGAQKRAELVGSAANQWSKSQFGVDVAQQIGGVVGTVKDRAGFGPERSGYGALSMHHDGESSALYQDDSEEGDFFGEFKDSPHGSHSQGFGNETSTFTSGSHAAPSSGQKDDWDEWKDF